MEILMAACYMFDHVADGQLVVSSAKSASEELALAIAMLSCAHAEIAQVLSAITDNTSGLCRIFTNFVEACAGQLMDATLEQSATYDAAKSFEMTALKSGNIGRVSAAIGSLICSADEAKVQICSDFGFHIFTFAQLVDDIRDSCYQENGQTDLEMGKKTLPLALLAKRIPQNEFASLSTNMNLAQIQFENSGALIATQLVAETALNSAKDCIALLRRSGSNTTHFEMLVATLEQGFGPIDHAID